MYLPRHERHPNSLPEPTNHKKMVEILDALQRHTGGLATIALFKIVCPGTKDMADFRDLLQPMYHHGYIDRPETLNPKKSPGSWHIYRLMPPKSERGEARDKGRKLLAEYRRLTPYKHPPSNYPTHDYLTSKATSSIEIAAKAAGFKFIPWYEILARPRCPETTRNPKPVKTRTGKPRVPSPFEIPADFTATFKYQNKPVTWHIQTPTIFDETFGIDYGDNVRAFFFQETDLDTEDGYSSDQSKSSLISKFLRAHHIASKHIYDAHFGLPNFKMLFLTTSKARVDLAEEMLMANFKLPPTHGKRPGASYIAMQHVDPHGPPIIPELFDKPWRVAGLPDFQINHP